MRHWRRPVVWGAVAWVCIACGGTSTVQSPGPDGADFDAPSGDGAGTPHRDASTDADAGPALDADADAGPGLDADADVFVQPPAPCAPCDDGATCHMDSDCASGVCVADTCQPPSCTDGVKNADETDVDCGGHCGPGSCQAGQHCQNDEACGTPPCDSTGRCGEYKLVFVTSVLFDGNLAGLAGADNRCQVLASTAGLPGAYKAWLSGSSASATSRLAHATVPYVRVDGARVADDWADLVDGSLDNAIDRTETGGAPPKTDSICGFGNDWVFTSTLETGALHAADQTCGNYALATGSSTLGRYTLTGDGWTLFCSGGSCSKHAALYCIEQ